MPDAKTLKEHLARARAARNPEKLREQFAQARAKRTLEQMQAAAAAARAKRGLKPCNCGHNDGPHLSTCPVRRREVKQAQRARKGQK